MKGNIKSKIRDILNYLLFCFCIFGVPGFLYYLIKWDPYLGRGDESISLSLLLIALVYWILIFQIYKYRERARNRLWQFSQFLSDKWTEEKREDERRKRTMDFSYMMGIKEEYPEIFDNGILKLPNKK